MYIQFEGYKLYNVSKKFQADYGKHNKNTEKYMYVKLTLFHNCVNLTFNLGNICIEEVKRAMQYVHFWKNVCKI